MSRSIANLLELEKQKIYEERLRLGYLQNSECQVYYMK